MVKNTKIKRPKIKILYDSREQTPFTFKDYEWIESTKETLDFGDYTMVGHDLYRDDHSVIVERKANAQELVNNIGTNWERFLREMENVTKYRHKMILVCGPNNIEFLYRQGFTKISPNFFYKQLAILQTEYNVPTIFMQDYDHAESYIVRYFGQIQNLLLKDE